MEPIAATEERTAVEAGWHVSRFNLMAKVPDSKNVVIANLYKGSCAEYTPIEMFLLSSFDKLAEDHPIIERFARRDVICRIADDGNDSADGKTEIPATPSYDSWGRVGKPVIAVMPVIDRSAPVRRCVYSAHR